MRKPKTQHIKKEEKNGKLQRVPLDFMKWQYPILF